MTMISAEAASSTWDLEAREPHNLPVKLGIHFSKWAKEAQTGETGLPKAT